MYAALRTITEPVKAPVTWKQVYTHLRLDSDTDEELVWGYVRAATQWCEAYLNQTLITTTYSYSISNRNFLPNSYLYVLPLSVEAMYRGAPSQYIEIPRGPLQAITTLSRVNDDGTSTALTDYYADTTSSPGTIRMAGGSGYGSGSGDVSVTYTAGYGNEPENVPVSLRHAVLMLTSFLYENRGDVESDMPNSVARLLSMYRVPSFA
jgi:uncharacterized phiE125 gp8 family phage protein